MMAARCSRDKERIITEEPPQSVPRSRSRASG